MSTSPKRLAALASAALAVAGITVLAPPAQAAGTGLVISEVYGGGGNAGATYKRDFVELYNPTASRDQPRSAGRVQYRSATGAGDRGRRRRPDRLDRRRSGYYLDRGAAAGADGAAACRRPTSRPARIAMAAGGWPGLAARTAPRRSTQLTATSRHRRDRRHASAAAPRATSSRRQRHRPRPPSTPASRTASPASADTDNNNSRLPRSARRRPKAPGAGPEPFTGTIAEIQGNGPIADEGRLHRHHHAAW